MTARSAQILLIAVITTRATALLFSKMLLLGLGPFALLGVRFLLAFALLVLIFHRKLAHMSRRAFFYGLALGAGFFVVMALILLAILASCLPSPRRAKRLAAARQSAS